MIIDDDDSMDNLNENGLLCTQKIIQYLMVQ